MSNYISTVRSRVFQEGFGFALVENYGTPKAPLYRESFKIYRDPEGGLWVTGEFGKKYGIEFIVPNYGQRYGTVCTVDGRSIMTGKKVLGTAKDIGWVFTPAEYPGANVIPGWKQPGNNKVAAFVLAEPEYSYAVLTGSSEEETGVIAVRFFHEYVEPTYYDEAPNFRGGEKGAPSTFGGGRGAGTKRGMGTGMGPDVTTRGGGTRGGGTRETKGMGTGYGEDVKLKTSTTEFIPDLSRPPVTLILRIAQEHELIRGGCELVYDPTYVIPGSKAQPFVEPPKGFNPYR